MECPKCSVIIKFDNNTPVKWKNIWGGKIKYQKCSSWLQLSRRSSILFNLSIILVALGTPFLTYYFPVNPYALIACGVMFVTMVFVFKTRKWIVSDAPNT